MEPTIETNAAQGTGTPRRTWSSPPYLLLADDDRGEAAALAELLRQQRIRCDAVHSAEDALRAFRARDYDMLLMNLRAPLQAGLDAAETIRTLERSIPEPRVPVVIMTDGATDAQRRSAIGAHVDDVLERSREIGDLLAVVESFFSRSDVRQRTLSRASRCSILGC